MSSPLKHYKLGELCRVKHGWPFQGEYFSDEGERVVLTPANFFEEGGFKRVLGKEKYYHGDFPEEYLCAKGDLIVVMTQQAEGLLGSTALVPEDGVYLHNQRIGLITHNEELVDKQFLYYLFMTSSVRKQLRNSASGTKVKHTSPEKIYDVDVYIPDITIQRKSAKFLSYIDEKLRVNNSILSRLEQMSDTLYNYWFVQFDFPCKEGKPYSSSGKEMVWCEELSKDIPVGWNVADLNTLMSISTSAVNPKTYKETVFEHYSIPAFDAECYPVFENGDCIESNKYIVSPDSILVSKLNPQFKRLWDPFCVTENAICSTEFIVFNPLEVWKRPYCYALMNSDEFYSHMVAKAVSSTGSRKRIQPNVSASFRVAMPPDDIIEAFCHKYKPLLSKQKQIKIENQKLKRIKQWLLPLLMNGQATIE